ncbi:MAG: hypothetical protein ACR2O6_08465 [Ilumatobacteraceae bacterium]
MTDESSFGVGDLDALAQQAVDTVMRLVRRGLALAGGVLLIAAFCSIGGFMLGLAALSGGWRTLWILLGGFFLVVSIGAVIVAMWRLRAVRGGADALVGEVRRLIGKDDQAEQVVIETVEVGETAEEESAVVLSRQFFQMQGAVDRQPDSYAAISKALRAVTGFPVLLALSAFVSMIFAGLGLLFLIALAV